MNERMQQLMSQEYQTRAWMNARTMHDDAENSNLSPEDCRLTQPTVELPVNWDKVMGKKKYRSHRIKQIRQARNRINAYQEEMNASPTNAIETKIYDAEEGYRTVTVTQEIIEQMKFVTQKMMDSMSPKAAQRIENQIPYSPAAMREVRTAENPRTHILEFANPTFEAFDPRDQQF